MPVDDEIDVDNHKHRQSLFIVGVSTALLKSVREWSEENSTVILRAGREVVGLSTGRRPPGDKETW